jgi:glyoxylase-like metal-dependent hydrolase (beta-lactamase superfamily II)
MASTSIGESVADGIGLIPGSFVNSFTYREGDEIYLIDTGFSANARPILRAFEAAHVPLARVGKILLTHHHPDHVGGAASILKNVSAPVSCHTEDVPFVDGRSRRPGPFLMRLLLRSHPVPVAVALKDQDMISSLLVVHAPGHTPGEVAFYLPARKILFSGDAVVERKGRLTFPAPKAATSLEQAIQSLSRLRELDIELLLPGHGVPVTKDVASKIDDLIRRAPTEFLGRAAPLR